MRVGTDPATFAALRTFASAVTRELILHREPTGDEGCASTDEVAPAPARA